MHPITIWVHALRVASLSGAHSEPWEGSIVTAYTFRHGTRGTGRADQPRTYTH
jgi:hypothetical protein